MSEMQPPASDTAPTASLALASPGAAPTPGETPLEIVATVSRVVSQSVDRVTGNRVDTPLLVAAACVEALKGFGIRSQVMYGPVAWVEVLEDHRVIWAGCWGKSFHFWVATEFGEVVDLTTSAAHRKRAHDNPSWKPLYSPPMLWSREIPRFYRYLPDGVAELDLQESQDHERLARVLRDVHTHCNPAALALQTDTEFPNEPILCPGRRLLDDSQETFKKFDRALSVQGIPPAPI